MMEQRNTSIQITEFGPHTVINVNANERIEFSLTIEPKKFSDPELAKLQRIVDHQRTEITKALEDGVKLSAANDALTAELANAKRTIRNGSRSKKTSRR